MYAENSFTWTSNYNYNTYIEFSLEEKGFMHTFTFIIAGLEAHVHQVKVFFTTSNIGHMAKGRKAQMLSLQWKESTINRVPEKQCSHSFYLFYHKLRVPHFTWQALARSTITVSYSATHLGSHTQRWGRAAALPCQQLCVFFILAG